MATKDYVRACPKCGATNFHKESDVSVIAGGSGIFVCDNCGFSAPFFPEVKKSSIKNFKKQAVVEKTKESKKPKKKTPPVSSKESITVIVLGVLVLIFFGIVPFLVAVGGYYSIKFFSSKKK